jgi:hypothetical protein
VLKDRRRGASHMEVAGGALSMTATFPPRLGQRCLWLMELQGRNVLQPDALNRHKVEAITAWPTEEVTAA